MFYEVESDKLTFVKLYAFSKKVGQAISYLTCCSICLLTLLLLWRVQPPYFCKKFGLFVKVLLHFLLPINRNVCPGHRHCKLVVCAVPILEAALIYTSSGVIPLPCSTFYSVSFHVLFPFQLNFNFIWERCSINRFTKMYKITGCPNLEHPVIICGAIAFLVNWIN